MLSRAQNTFHHNPRLRGPVSSSDINECITSQNSIYRGSYMSSPVLLNLLKGAVTLKAVVS